MRKLNKKGKIVIIMFLLVIISVLTVIYFMNNKPKSNGIWINHTSKSIAFGLKGEKVIIVYH